MDNIVIVSTIAGYLDKTIHSVFDLSTVNRAFYTVFTGDEVWKRFDVYNVKQNIYLHYVDMMANHRRNRVLDFGDPTPNKYEWLHFLTVVGRIPNSLLADVDFMRVAVAYDPAIYLLLDGHYLNDKQIAKSAICNQYPRHSAIAHRFWDTSPLAHDKGFCLEAVDGPWGHVVYGNLGSFSQGFCSDIDVLRIAANWHPKVILAFTPITKEIVDELVPTETDFLPVIESFGKFLPKFFEFYNSPKVLYTALQFDPEDYEWVDNLRGLAKNGQFSTETEAALECWIKPELFDELDKDLKSNADLVAFVLCSPTNRKVLETYDGLSDKLKSNKNIIAAVLGSSVKTKDDFELLLEHLPQKETQQVLADSRYAERLVLHNWVLFNFVKAPVTDKLIQSLLPQIDEIVDRLGLPRDYDSAEFLEGAVKIFRDLSDTNEEILNHLPVFAQLLDNGGDEVLSLSTFTLPPKFQKDGTLLAAVIGSTRDCLMALELYSYCESCFNDEAKQDPRVLQRIFWTLKRFADGEKGIYMIEAEPEKHVALVKFLKQENTKKRVKELEAFGKLDAGIYEKGMDYLNKLIDIECSEKESITPQAAELTSTNTAPQRAQQQQLTGNPPKSQQEKDKGCCIIA